MIDVTNICSLTDFQKQTKKHLRRLKRTGKPEVLTLNGQAEVVVQSAQAYQELLERADLGDSVRILTKRLADNGKKDSSADKVLDEIKARLGPGATR